MRVLSASLLTLTLVTVAALARAPGWSLAALTVAGGAVSAWLVRCAHPADAVRLTAVTRPDGRRVAVVECECGRTFPLVRDVEAEAADPAHKIGTPRPATARGYLPALAVQAGIRADAHAAARRKAEAERGACRPAAAPAAPRRRRRATVTPIADRRHA